MNGEDFKCGGVWFSEVNGTDDGAMSIDVVSTVTGALGGVHFRPGTTPEFRTISGSCIRPTALDPRHRIEFYSLGTRPHYFYHGEIETESDGITRARGKRVSLGLTKEQFELLRDDDWVGTHTT